jgi:general secretion pathway protein G
MVRLLLIVLAVLSTLTGAGCRSVPEAKVDSRPVIARQRAELLALACKLFQDKYGRYPEELREVATMPPEDPYVKEEDLVDPWGKPYLYSPPTGYRKTPLVLSISPDGKTYVGDRNR